MRSKSSLLKLITLHPLSVSRSAKNSFSYRNGNNSAVDLDSQKILYEIDFPMETNLCF